MTASGFAGIDGVLLSMPHLQSMHAYCLRVQTLWVLKVNALTSGLS